MYIYIDKSDNNITNKCKFMLKYHNFHFDKAECYSRCIFNIDGDGKIHECGAKVNGKFKTNLINHLRKHHPDILKELEKRRRKKRKLIRSSIIIFINALRLKDNCL